MPGNPLAHLLSLYLPSHSVMELAVLAKWLLPEIMEFAAWALLMTAKSQVSGFRKGPEQQQQHKQRQQQLEQQQ